MTIGRRTTTSGEVGNVPLRRWQRLLLMLFGWSMLPILCAAYFDRHGFAQKAQESRHLFMVWGLAWYSVGALYFLYWAVRTMVE